MNLQQRCFLFFFFNDTATTEIYTLSLHDALPIWAWLSLEAEIVAMEPPILCSNREVGRPSARSRSEEHTSELQSQSNLVCRLLLEKKKRKSLGLYCVSTTLMRVLVRLLVTDSVFS